MGTSVERIRIGILNYGADDQEETVQRKHDYTGKRRKLLGAGGIRLFAQLFLLEQGMCKSCQKIERTQKTRRRKRIETVSELVGRRKLLGARNMKETRMAGE